ncbi:MAG: organic hydroperoxide resistance protein [Bdellovibrionales bacterium]|nr:organic hydroperoxide resistance protein [Oligoflexia bacterium]
MKKIEKVLYKGMAKSVGGREGNTISSDQTFNLKLSTPKEMGGAGGSGTNPEQLFAAGYSACFLGALKVVAGMQKVTLPPETSINGIVGFGAVAQGYLIEAELQISIPGIDKAVANSLIEKAHQVCPYSNATRGNIDVTLTLV